MMIEEYSYDDICERQQIATTIRKQIGVEVLMACGAREYSIFEPKVNGLKFRVKHGRDREYIIVHLTGNDDYTIELRKITKKGEIVQEIKEGIYCDQLSMVVYRMVNK